MNKKNFFQRRKMPLTELEEYYRTYRAETYANNVPIRGIGWRRKVHPILLGGLCINRWISRQKLNIIADKHNKTGNAVIYACTHIGWNDIEIAFSAIRTHAYLFLGDPREIYRRIEGILLWINGVICCDTGFKKDRFIGKEMCIRLLQQGGSLLIYPEGAWNIIENQVVMPLYSGVIEMAIRTEAEIVPIAIEQYDKDYYVNIGENIKLEESSLSQKQEEVEKLRDVLCTLKWEIWEKYGRALRADFPDGYIKTFLAKYEEQIDEVYTLDDIHRTRYHLKISSPEEAFAFMQDLIPSRENAFLIKNRYNEVYLRKGDEKEGIGFIVICQYCSGDSGLSHGRHEGKCGSLFTRGVSSKYSRQSGRSPCEAC